MSKLVTTYNYFILGNRLIPVIEGSDTSMGSSIAIDFSGGVVYNPSASKSTDILFTQLALGEGPVYRINPNGPQDIEIENKYIDDLVNFSTNTTKSDVFIAKYSTGANTVSAMSSFFTESITPVRFASPVVLKSGLSADPETPPVAPASVLFFPTSTATGVAQTDTIRFRFNITELKTQSAAGTEPGNLNLAAIVHPQTETENINNYIAGGGFIVNSLVEGGMAVEFDVKIPNESRSNEGYRISVLKLTEDIAEEGFIAEVEFVGFDEIKEVMFAYPRTAIAGYAIKSSDYRTGSIPNYTSLLKGMLVSVPSNYSQPVLSSGEVDWRQIELPATGYLSAASNGYRTQKNPTTVSTDTNILIYDGIWDGTFKRDWTQNPVWIIYFLLTDKTHGLGLPESAIDKYNFYTTAQYCDAVDPMTGCFTGVTGYADGTFRYKPNNYLTSVQDILLGIPEGTKVLERRFVCDISITDSTMALDLIQAISSSFRAVLTVRGSKFSFIVDKENMLPEAIFNDTNIEKDSLSISGVREDELITGVEVSYIDFADHFKKTTIVLDAEEEVFNIEKRLSVDAVGCTRKSQALRLARYLLDTNRNIRRRIQFKASSEASDLSVGSIVSISQKSNNLNYGYGGIVIENSNIGTSNVVLQYISSPEITDSFFTNNTYPIALKVFNNRSNKLTQYIIDGSYSITDTYIANDTISISVSDIMTGVNSFQPFTSFSANNVPEYGDLWSLGYVNPNSTYNNTADKLFRINTLDILEDNTVSISASEYDSDILQNSDTEVLDITSAYSKSTNFTAPPPPVLQLSSIPTKTNEGVVLYNMLIGSTTDSANYTNPISTVLQYGLVPFILDIDATD